MRHGRGGTAGVALLALAAALLAALPYLAAGLPDGFIAFDDDEYVLENPAVRAGLTAEGARWAFGSFHAANWHPLTWLSHMLDVQLFGLDARGHHLTSVLLHAVSAALLLVAAHRLTGMRWRSALVAFLFAVHPLRVESVAWVAERKDVLAGLCFMLVLLAYERAVRRGSGAASPPVILLLALGLTAKPMLVTAPLVLLLLDFWPLGRARPAEAGARVPGGLRLLAEKLPLLALAVLSAVITVAAQRGAGALLPVEASTAAARVSTALSSIVAYLAKSSWPSGLAPFYPLPAAPQPWPATAAALALPAATLLAIRGRARLPFLAAGWLWFLGMLLPVLGLVQAGSQSHADRYTYLPQIGLLFAVVWGGAALAAAACAHRSAALAGAAAIAALAALSVAQAARWRDSETLFRHTLAVTSDNWLIQGNLGFLLFSQGRHAEAEAHLREAVRLNPASASAQNSLGNVLAATGRSDEALAAYRAAAGADPRYPRPHYNLGNLLAGLGRLDEAADAYRAAIRLDPGYALAHANLASVLGNSGRLTEAEASFREALRLRPAFPEAWLGLGQVLALGGRGAEALPALREAARLGPDDPEVHERLAALLPALGLTAEATGHREQARRLRSARVRR